MNEIVQLRGRPTAKQIALDTEVAKALWKQGCSVPEIARRLNSKPETIEKRLGFEPGLRPVRMHSLDEELTDYEATRRSGTATPYQPPAPTASESPVTRKEKKMEVSQLIRSPELVSVQRVTPAGRADGKPDYFRVRVPRDVAERIEKLETLTFSVELTDEGLLFRPTTGAPTGVVPAWARNGRA